MDPAFQQFTEPDRRDRDIGYRIAAEFLRELQGFEPFSWPQFRERASLTTAIAVGGLVIQVRLTDKAPYATTADPTPKR